MLLSLNGLVKAVGITASRHDTPCEFIDNQNLVVLYHIILVPEHQIIGPERKDDIVLNL